MAKSRLLTRIIASVAVLSMLAACQQPNGSPDPYVNKTNVGMLGGAALGGIAGHNIGKGRGQTIATIAGTLIGAGLGHQIGASLDRADMAYYEKTSQRAMETAQPGQSLPWSNPETGNRGTITPSNYYQTANGQYCREYNQTITVGGRTERGYGTACRQADGSWQIVE
jgi:surface antigen